MYSEKRIMPLAGCDRTGTISTRPFTVNGRTYQPPARPVVVICIDGGGDEYLDAALINGRMPRLARMVKQGYRGMARGALPSFTNVNNACIVTGVPPAITGISGNFFLDPQTGAEVMMNSGRYLRCETILAGAARAGRKVALVTAKEKLRDLLAHDLDGIAFSAEKADEAAAPTHGIGHVEEVVGAAAPAIYSAEASLFVLRAGVRLIERGLADFLYLSLTDYVQHKHAPSSPEALDFYAGIDREIGRLLDLGAVIGATADHGMNAKSTADGQPNVILLQGLLTDRFGPGIRVICPITDPYVLHHGALGSLVMVHLSNAASVDRIARWLWKQDGITEVYDRAMAARKLELPADRIGDLVVLSGRNVALGRTPNDHDLKLLAGGLRTHGGRYEEMVPLLLSEPLTGEPAARAAGDPRNFDVFSFTCI
jgi:phosphonoacetate hydrolase